jgi:dUTP pyrophosphatase
VRVKIRRIDPSLPLPSYATEGATGFDFLSRLDITVDPGAIAHIPTNVVVSVPHGYLLVVALRSGTPRRKGLLSPHGVGVIDQDYRGPEDEIQVQVYNFSHAPVVVQRGERIAQGILIPVGIAAWDELESSDGESRGGFGSTG